MKIFLSMLELFKSWQCKCPRPEIYQHPWLASIMPTLSACVNLMTMKDGRLCPRFKFRERNPIMASPINEWLNIWTSRVYNQVIINMVTSCLRLTIFDVEQHAFTIKHRIPSAQIPYFQVLQQILQTVEKFEDSRYTTNKNMTNVWYTLRVIWQKVNFAS